ncbi:DUF523 domain-containing protein [Facilibium subflavum]|uniref:DUF523 domain-containing protein n=1 Tax=Facilibium subflavum TaxID=2219058 RepID=UPI000E6580EE|nr:DUF523 domain-containing protein [Facilibium subflavum]
MIKILVSSCLFGCNVRYHGKAAEIHQALFAKWCQEGRIVHFCPEVQAGLPIPRNPSEIVKGTGIDVLNGYARVLSKDKEDKSDAFIKGAYLTLAFAQKHQIKVALLKKNSPSCGNTSIYDGTHTGKLINGSGVTAALLMRNGIKVYNENELHQLHEYIMVNESI